MTPSATHDWKRHEMWCSLIPGYGCKDKNEKKRAKRAYAEERGVLPHMIMKEYDSLRIASMCKTIGPDTEYSLGNLKAKTPYIGWTTDVVICDELTPGAKLPYDYEYEGGVAPVNNKTNKENKMFYDEDGMCAGSETLLQRNQLVSRIRDIACEKDEELERFFGLKDDAAPKTVNEIIERIKAGKFTIDEDKGDKQGYGPLNYLNWRDPSKKKDQAGYNAAVIKLRAAQEEATDLVTFKTVDEGFAALQAFKAQTFH